MTPTYNKLLQTIGLSTLVVVGLFGSLFLWMSRSSRTSSALAGMPQVTVIYSSIQEDVSSEVPGMPGVRFDVGTDSFDRVYGSPNGNWVLTAVTDLPTASDELLLVNGVVRVRKGTPTDWAPAESYGTLTQRIDINDAGQFVFYNNTTGPTTADQYILLGDAITITVVAQEGSPTHLPDLPGSVWGSILDSPVIDNNGVVGFSADQLDGVPANQNDILVLGDIVLGQQEVTVPPGQIGSEFWENFTQNGFWLSADGTNWLVQGDLTGSSSTDGLVVVNGTAVVQEGTILSGTIFTEPVDTSGIVGVFMGPNGDWFVRGNNDATEQDWVYSNGALLAATGWPIYVGASEHYTDTEFADTFFLHVANGDGDFILGGVSDGPTDSNGVLVLNNTMVIAREGDPVDLDGNGIFDDGLYLHTFGNDDGFFADNGLFYFVATLRDNSNTAVGQGFFVIDLSELIDVTPVPTATATHTVPATPTFTPTASQTPTITPTATVTPTATMSATASVTPTLTPTLTVTATGTITPTVVPTQTATPLPPQYGLFLPYISRP